MVPLSLADEPITSNRRNGSLGACITRAGLRHFTRGMKSRWPTLLQGWDLRGRIGIEYTYLYYVINGGSTPTHLAPGGEETAEDFYHQSMPLPTIGLEAYHLLFEGLLFQAEVEGNWI